MPVDKRIFVNSGGGARKGGMDKDTDPRYVQNGFYTNARNVSYMVNGNNFVVTNLKGNTSKSYTLNAGDNICIGAYDDKGLETVYYFIWNGNGDHEVVSYGYSLSDGTFTQLAEGSGLGFVFNKLITGIVLVLDRYLVWTQEDQEIGCIDLENLPATTITTANRALVELYKIPNPTPLEPSYCTITSVEKNNLFGKLYKFRTRYVYKGGFRTHPSTISKLAAPQFGNEIRDNKVGYDNRIYMKVDLPSTDEVEKVELLVQSGSDDNTMGLWYKFKELTYDEIDQNVNNSVTVIFTGDEPLLAVDQTEMAMPFSFIPSRAKEVVFLPSNVLSFLNITEGFDADVDVRGQVYPIYNARSSTTTAGSTATYNASPVAVSGSFYNPNFDILLTTSLNYKRLTIAGTPRTGDRIGVTLVIFHTGTVPIIFVNKTLQFICPVVEGDTVTIIASKIANIINSTDTRYLGFGGIVAYSSGSVVRMVYGLNDSADPYTPTSGIASLTPIVVMSDSDRTQRSLPNLKRWREHYWALQYESNGRRSSAIPLDSFYAEGYDATTNDGWVSARAVIESLPPATADRYHLLYAKNSPEFLQIYVNLYPVVTLTFEGGTGTKPIEGQTIDASGGAVARVVKYTSGDSIEGVMDIAVVSGTVASFETWTYNTSTWSSSAATTITDNGVAAIDLADRIDYDIDTYGTTSQNFNFVDGDQIRLIAKYTTAPTFTYFSDIISTDIIESTVNFTTFNYDVSTLTPTVTGLTATLVEVWRPKSQTDPEIYYEIGKTFSIAGGYHVGDAQTQTASVGAIIDLSNIGDTWSRSSPTPVLEEVYYLTEANDFSPFYDSAVTAIGRPNVVTESGLDQIQRGAAIAFTQPIIPQSTTNGLSIVLGSSIKTYDDSFGSIQKASLRQNKQLIVYFEDKVGQIGILEELAKQDSSEITYQTTALLNGINYYEYDGGIGTNPEGFAKYNETHYFPSSRNNAICRLSSNGIQEISDYGMTTWFNENLDVKDVYAADRKILGVYDERLQNYTVSIMGYFQASSLGGSNQQLSFTLNNAFRGNLEGLIEGVVLFDGTDYYFERGVTVSINSSNQADVAISGSPAAQNVTAAWLRYRIDTPMFNEPSNSWVSFSDITPDYMVTTGVDFSSFKDGGLWVHNTNNAYGSLYGVAKNAEITVPFNTAPDKQKRLQTIELEANSVWTSETDGDINIEDGNQTSQLFENFYSEYQPNEWAAGFRQDTLTPNRTNALLEGYDLRGKYGTIRLLSDATTQAKLASMGVQFFISESSL